MRKLVELRHFFKKRGNYQERLKSELAHYEEVFSESLTQQVPDSWMEVEKHFAQKVKDKTTYYGFPEYVAGYAKGKKKISMLSLGSGACGVELDSIAPLIRKHGCELSLTCVDVNDEVMQKAGREAIKRGIKFKGLALDINKIILDEKKYDVVIAFAALHHFIELDHIAKEISKALKSKGIFVTVDIPTRNGYLMWDETLKVINHIWQILPDKYKLDHTVTTKPIFIDKYPNIDYAKGSFECANSEAILPALRKHLKEICFVPAFSIARRFFDTKFGSNFDLREKLDKSIFEFLMNLDEYYLSTNTLKPETFFGVYTKVK